MTPRLSPNGGVHVPNWLVNAVVVAMGLIGAGVVVGQKMQSDAEEKSITNYRLCRIERALSIEPWQSCPIPITQPRSKP